LRFRCQIGHAYTSDILSAENECSVDEAVRLALRIIEERVTLSEKMADDAGRNGLQAAAAANRRRAEEMREHAQTLRRAIVGKSLKVPAGEIHAQNLSPAAPDEGEGL
jgi:two-component system chemotaxis response regulator CheB